MKKWTPILWFKFRVKDGVTWKVYLVSRDGCEEMEDYESTTGERIAGLTHADGHTIFIDAGSELWDQADTVLHELIHVCFGGEETLPISMEIEEECVRHITPTLLHLVRKLGFRMPKRPQGYVALARHARRFNQR